MAAQSSERLHRTQRLIRFAGLRSAMICVIVSAALFFATAAVDWPKDLSARLAYTLQLNILIVLWLAIGIGRVSRSRRHSVEDIDAALSEGRSKKIAIESAFLQNTLEQATLAIPTHLAFAALAPSGLLWLIPSAVLLFCVGRIFFWRGYTRGAEGRAFGMITTMLPTLIILAMTIVMAAMQLVGFLRAALV